VSRARSLNAPILQLRVALEEIEPSIWRRILVPSDLTFAKLHLVLQETMGWWSSHSHRFEIGDRRIGTPSDDLPLEDDRTIRIGQVLLEAGARARYEYDFDAGWRHEITVEKSVERDSRVSYPICIAGARACPPEDCGGASGYKELLAALADPLHEEHEHLLTWVGGHFDPEGFDVNRTNVAIRGIR